MNATTPGEGRPSLADKEQQPQYTIHLDLYVETVKSEKDSVRHIPLKNQRGSKPLPSLPSSVLLYPPQHPLGPLSLNLQFTCSEAYDHTSRLLTVSISTT